MKKISVRTKKIIGYVLVIIVSLVFTIFASKPNTFKTITQDLDEKKTTAMGIAATASTVSVALAAIPQDATTPIAQEIANISSYVLIAVCVLLAEKMLLTTLAVLAFGIAIPLACIIRIFCLFKENETLRNFSTRIVCLGLALFMVVPLSVGVSSLIEKTHKTSMEQSLAEVEQIQDNLENEGFLSKIKNGASELFETVKVKLNGFIDLVAVMIVTTCVIPILVLFFVLWLIKTIFGLNLKMPKPKGYLPAKLKIKEENASDISNVSDEIEYEIVTTE